MHFALLGELMLAYPSRQAQVQLLDGLPEFGIGLRLALSQLAQIVFLDPVKSDAQASTPAGLNAPAGVCVCVRQPTTVPWV